VENTGGTTTEAVEPCWVSHGGKSDRDEDGDVADTAIGLSAGDTTGTELGTNGEKEFTAVWSMGAILTGRTEADS
jgi:hypothetical protein